MITFPLIPHSKVQTLYLHDDAYQLPCAFCGKLFTSVFVKRGDHTLENMFVCNDDHCNESQAMLIRKLKKRARANALLAIYFFATPVIWSLLGWEQGLFGSLMCPVFGGIHLIAAIRLMWSKGYVFKYSMTSVDAKLTRCLFFDWEVKWYQRSEEKLAGKDNG